MIGESEGKVLPGALRRVESSKLGTMVAFYTRPMLSVSHRTMDTGSFVSFARLSCNAIPGHGFVVVSFALLYFVFSAVVVHVKRPPLT